MSHSAKIKESYDFCNIWQIRSPESHFKTISPGWIVTDDWGAIHSVAWLKTAKTPENSLANIWYFYALLLVQSSIYVYTRWETNKVSLKLLFLYQKIMHPCCLKRNNAQWYPSHHHPSAACTIPMSAVAVRRAAHEHENPTGINFSLVFQF